MTQPAQMPQDLATHIRQAKEFLRQADHQAFASQLHEIAKSQPQGWWNILLLEDLVPNANGRDWDKQLPCFLKAISEPAVLNHMDGDDLDRAVRAIQTIIDIGSRLDDIRDRLKEASFFNDAKATQICRLAMWIESQARYSEGILHDSARKAGFFDATRAIETSHKGKWAPQGVDLSSNLEAMCEAIDLILRFILRTDAGDFGACDWAKSPYEDPGFEEVTVLSGTWQNLDHIWGCSKFCNWRCRVSDKAVLYSPTNEEDLVRDFVSQIRQMRFKSQDMLGVIFKASDSLSDGDWTIRKLARKVIIPEAGQKWNCRLDPALFKASLEYTQQRYLVDWFSEHRHYQVLIEEAEKGMGSDQIKWSEWLCIREAVYILAKVFVWAYGNQVLNDGKERPELERQQRSVVWVDKEDLVASLASVTSLTADRIRLILPLLTFSPDHRQFDIWDHPLLPFGESRLLLVPHLIVNGDVLLGLENLTRHFKLDGFSERGLPFETFLANELNRVKGVKAKAGIDAPLKGGGSKNFDVIAWWDGHLFLIEAKCIRSIFDPSAEFNGRQHLDKALEQLGLRRAMLNDCWEGIRAEAPELGLPQNIPSQDRIHTIAVTNQMRFTPAVIDDTFVTDDLCLLRFFGDRDIFAYMTGAGGSRPVRSVGTIRPSYDLRVSEFLSYLKDPPQVRMIREKVKLATQPIPSLRNGGRLALMPYYSYGGNEPLA